MKGVKYRKEIIDIISNKSIKYLFTAIRKMNETYIRRLKILRIKQNKNAIRCYITVQRWYIGIVKAALRERPWYSHE